MHWRDESSDEMRRTFIDRAADPALHHGERFEVLQRLAISSCTNVRELLVGPRAEVTDAFRNARRDLARYPSERSLVDLIGQLPNASLGMPQSGAFDAIAVGSATIAGVVLHNPRLATCTRIAGIARPYP